MSQWFAWSSKSVLNSAIACVPIRPLRMNTVNLPRAAVSILKTIDQATPQSQLCCTGILLSKHQPRAVQPNAQLDLTENRARKRNWSDRILGNARILGVERRNLPDGLFLYVELFDLQIQRRPRNSEFGSRPVEPGNFSVAHCKSCFDKFLLIATQGLGERT